VRKCNSDYFSLSIKANTFSLCNSRFEASEIMHFYNKKRNNSKLAAAIFTLAIMAASSMVAPAVATTAPSASSSAIELSPEPVYREQQINVSQTPINQTHIQLTISGNGTLALPNGTEAINTTSSGSIIVSMDGAAAGKEVITTLDGSESATATIYAIARFGEENEIGRGIVTALVDTNSTGRLAPLDGMILAGHVEFPPDETAAFFTLWEWQSGVPLPTSTTAQAPLLMDTTTTTNATADTNVTAATTPPEEEVVEEQQQQATPTAPAPLLE
jgi:hypothetical protein